MPPLPDWFAWAALSLVLVLSWLWWRARNRVGRANRRRQRRARTGEIEAEALLRDHGYEILDRQVDRPWKLWVSAINSCFPVNCLASRTAPSTASAPLLAKKLFFRFPGVISASRLASSPARGL